MRSCRAAQTPTFGVLFVFRVGHVPQYHHQHTKHGTVHLTGLRPHEKLLVPCHQKTTSEYRLQTLFIKNIQYIPLPNSFIIKKTVMSGACASELKRSN